MISYAKYISVLLRRSFSIEHQFRPAELFIVPEILFNFTTRDFYILLKIIERGKLCQKEKTRRNGQ